MGVILNNENNSVKLSKPCWILLATLNKCQHDALSNYLRPFYSSGDFADGYKILSWGWGDVFFVLFQPDKIIPFTRRPNANGLSSQLSCLPPRDIYILSCQTLKKKDTISCVCVCDKRAEGVQITVSCWTEKLPMPRKNGGNNKKSENSHSAFIATNRGSITHQKNNVVIIYCCYISQFSSVSYNPTVEYTKVMIL
jgi:hypothetical protein